MSWVIFPFIIYAALRMPSDMGLKEKGGSGS